MSQSSEWQVEVFYDGDCPLCAKEIRMLRWMDRKRQQIRFTDISDAGFDPQSCGKSMKELMDEIHGRLPDGSTIVGVEVFRRLYSAVGFRWIVALSRIPGISHLLDVMYQYFAKYRLRLTGRCDVNGESACRVKNEVPPQPVNDA